jgi:hypothetical protein
MIREFGEPLSSDIDRGKLRNSENNLSQYHCVRHKPHMARPGANPVLRGERPATKRLSDSTVFEVLLKK